MTKEIEEETKAVEETTKPPKKADAVLLMSFYNNEDHNNPIVEFRSYDQHNNHQPISGSMYLCAYEMFIKYLYAHSTDLATLEEYLINCVKTYRNLVGNEVLH